LQAHLIPSLAQWTPFIKTAKGAIASETKKTINNKLDVIINILDES
jgi:hypothetical protein